MAFERHEPCPRCGSKDNLARYADGSAWCFGCHYHEKRTHAPSTFLSRASGTVSQDVPEFPRIPDDAGTEFSEEAVAWLAQYHLWIPDAIRLGVVFSPSKRQIIYQMGNVWQARNLHPQQSLGNKGRPRSKNFTSGDVNECLHIYGHHAGSNSGDTGQLSSETLVIVEDPVSAMRIAPLRPSMPLLGSHLATKRLIALTGLYCSMIFWLDSDKLKEAREMAQRAGLIDIQTRVIYTELDPKCHTYEQLMEILK